MGQAAAAEADEAEATGGIQSVETGFRLLLALAEPGPPRMLKAIAEAAGMPPSKAHRYLASLSRLGFADRDPASGRYRLGPAVLHLGLVALGNLNPVRVGSEALLALRDTVDETVALAVWGSAGPTFVRLEEAARPVTVNAKPGFVLPILASATGRVFGAFLPAARIAPVLAAELAAPHRPGMPRDLTEAWALLETVRQEGLGRVTGEMMAGIHALSVPIRDHQGHVVAALTALGAAGAFDDRAEGRIATALRDAAARAARDLGWRG